MKRIISVLLAAVMMLTLAVSAFAASNSFLQTTTGKVGQTYEVSSLKVEVTKDEDGSREAVVVTSTKAKDSKQITIPATVTIQGDKFNIVGIKENAFKDYTKQTKLVIKTKKLASVGKKAVRNTKKITVYVPSGKKAAYSKLFKDAGITKVQYKINK